MLLLLVMDIHEVGDKMRELLGVLREGELQIVMTDDREQGLQVGTKENTGLLNYPLEPLAGLLGGIAVNLHKARHIRLCTVLAEDAKTLASPGNQVHPSTLQTLRRLDLGHRANRIRLFEQGFALRARQHHPKRQTLLIALADHLAVARLKDVQRQLGARK